MTDAKRITTFDDQGKENGFLIELEKDGPKTTSYLTCCKPGAMKGFHLHKRRTSNYICVRGEMTIITFGPHGKEEKVITKGDTMSLGTGIPIGLKNNGDEEGWLINFPTPPYDPEDKDEQIEYTERTARDLFGL